MFAVGDVAERTDRSVELNGVQTMRAGGPLLANLIAAHEGQALKPHRPPRHSLQLIGSGADHAFASYGLLHAEGAWVWRWKERIDRAFMAAVHQPSTK